MVLAYSSPAVSVSQPVTNIENNAPAPLERALVERLRAICGREHVLTESIQLRTYESDGLLQYRATPGAVVLPGSATEVRDVVRACSDAGVPWVARGAGSGLSGGALPVADGVLIAVTRMRRVLEVDLENGRIVVEPGVTNTEVGAAVGPTHFYPPDRRRRSSARSAATSPRTPAARTASSTASRRTTSRAWSSCSPTARW